MAQAISKMETVQTAVEWLVDKLMQGEFINNPDELIQQAKAMEKEQIMNALPTDEDIDNYVDNLKGWVMVEKDFFRSGAKFMRNIIKNNDVKKMRNL